MRSIATSSIQVRPGRQRSPCIGNRLPHPVDELCVVTSSRRVSLARVAPGPVACPQLPHRRPLLSSSQFHSKRFDRVANVDVRRLVLIQRSQLQGLAILPERTTAPPRLSAVPAGAVERREPPRLVSNISHSCRGLSSPVKRCHFDNNCHPQRYIAFDSSCNPKAPSRRPRYPPSANHMMGAASAVSQSSYWRPLRRLPADRHRGLSSGSTGRARCTSDQKWVSRIDVWARCLARLQQRLPPDAGILCPRSPR